MLNVPIRTIWQGKAGVNEESYVKPALAQGAGLMLIHLASGDVMEIPPGEVGNTVGRSEYRFKDKYGGVDYYLVYYAWKPTAKQTKMF